MLKTVYRRYPTKIFNVEQQSCADRGVPNKAIQFFKWLRHRIAALFEPEEVEVTFDRDGHYTYTKVEHS